MATPEKFDYEKIHFAAQINELDPLPAVADNASWLSYLGYQQGLWEGVARRLKQQIINQESLVDQNARASGAKVTSDAIKAMANLDPEVQELKRKLAFAEEQDTCYSNALKTFNDRGQNARSINTSLRAEQSSASSFHMVPKSSTAAEREAAKESLKEALAKLG